MKKVMVTGTFDFVHKGHEYFLKAAKKHGDYLVVLIARDRTVKNVKGAKPMFDEKKRKEAVEKLGIANKVILGNVGDKYAGIEKENPAIICLGYDQRFFTDKLELELKKRKINAKIVRLRAFKPSTYKSSKLKKTIINIDKKYLYTKKQL